MLIIDTEIQECLNREILKECEDYYYRVEMPEVRKKISEFKTEMGNWVKFRRLSYLYERLFELDAELKDRFMRYQRRAEDDTPYIERGLIASRIPEIEKEIKRIETEIKVIVRGQKGKGITTEMIEAAKEYPLENLIEVKRSMALCPFHDDTHPSMSIKDNHYHCFGCGESGDPISFVMKRDGLNFAEAVKFLNGLNR